MVDGDLPTDEKRYQNKGVSITSDSLPPVNSQGIVEPLTVRHLRDHVRNVIDHMGPATPNFQNTSSEADNEESYYESTSLFSSIHTQVKVEKKSDTEDRAMSTETSTRDTSDPSAFISTEPQDLETMLSVRGHQHVEVCRCSTTTALAPPPIPLCAAPGAHCLCCTCSQPGQPPSGGHQSRRNFLEEKQKSFLCSLLQKSGKKRLKDKQPLELYKMNITQPADDHSPPRKLVFDLVEELPKPSKHNQSTNTHVPTLSHACTQNCRHVNKSQCCQTQYGYRSQCCQTHCGCESKYCQTRCNCNNKYSQYVDEHLENLNAMQKPINFEANYNGVHKHNINGLRQDDPKGMVVSHNIPHKSGKSYSQTTYYNDDKGMARVDVYYFDHGNSAYYRTTDEPPLIMTEILAEKTDNYTTKFWAELFGTVHIGFAFITSFILQFFRFILYTIVRPLTVGLIQLGSDYFFKPCLAVIFNAIIQPPLIFLFNIATSLRDLCDPIAEAIGYFLREIAVLLRAIRLVDLKKESCRRPRYEVVCECGKSKKEDRKLNPEEVKA